MLTEHRGAFRIEMRTLLRARAGRRGRSFSAGRNECSKGSEIAADRALLVWRAKNREPLMRRDEQQAHYSRLREAGHLESCKKPSMRGNEGGRTTRPESTLAAAVPSMKEIKRLQIGKPSQLAKLTL